MNRRQLYRCRHDQRIAGVAAGVAEYFDLDPWLVRVVWVVSIFFGGLGLLLYIAMALIVPLEPVSVAGAMPAGSGPAGSAGDPAEPANPGAWAADPAATTWSAAAPHRHAGRGSGFGTTFLGLVLILFGALALVDAYLPAWADHGPFLWPAFVLGLGVLLVATAMRRQPTEQ